MTEKIFSGRAFFITAALGALVLGIVTTGSAADIKGTVVVKTAVSPKQKTGLSALYSKPRPSSGSSNTIPDIVLYLKDFPGAPVPEPIPDVKLLQVNKEFVPHVLPVTVGTTVGFPNLDKIYHNVFSLSRGNTFKLGRYAMGKSESHTFTRPGIVDVFCEIHSDMHAVIVVLPNRFFAMADEEGRFVIPDVPPGDYTLVAWNDSLGQEEFDVTVPADGDVILTIEF